MPKAFSRTKVRLAFSRIELKRCLYQSILLHGAQKTTSECVVCHQICTGLHYGVQSCPACKSFFRRSIRLSQEYACPRENSCDLVGEHRVVCRACRLNRCFAVGMSQYAVEQDRGSIKRAVRQHRDSVWIPSSASPPAVSSQARKPRRPNEQDRASILQMLSMSLDIPEDEALFNNVVTNSRALLDFAINLHDTTVKAVDHETAVACMEVLSATLSLSECGTSIITGGCSNKSLSFPTTTFEVLLQQMETYVAALLPTLDNVSCFSRLDQDEKIALLRCCFPHVTLLSLMQANMSPRMHGCLVLIDGETALDPNGAPSNTISDVLREVSDELLPRFRELDIDAREFACMRLLALSSPEAVSDSEIKDKIRRLQKIILTILRKYISEKADGQATNALRFANILVLSGQVEAVGERMRSSLQSAAEKREIHNCSQGLLWDLLHSREKSPLYRSVSAPVMSMPMNTIAVEEVDEFARRIVQEIALSSREGNIAGSPGGTGASTGFPIRGKNAKDNLREFLLRQRSR